MDLKYIIFKSEDGIGWIQFNRPERLNAINNQLLEDLETALAVCEKDDAIRVVVLKGNEKAFVAGADIKQMATGDIKFAYELTDLNVRVQERLADLPKPTIAAVAGYALGGDANWHCAVTSGLLRIMPSWAFPRSPWGSFRVEGALNDSPAWWVFRRQQNSFYWAKPSRRIKRNR